MKCLVSIIVPVYNVEKYIDRCVESLISQTIDETEIILIDDGSTDSSGEVCDQWGKRESRIRVIHKENGGVSSARNEGIKISQGKYIGFVDPDDYVADDMFVSMIEVIQNNDIDLVCCNYSKFEEEKVPIPVTNSVQGEMTATEAIKHLLTWDGIVTSFVWDKLYKQEIVKQMTFSPALSVGEDTLFIFQYLSNCRKLHILQKHCYYYFLRSNSAIGDKYTLKKRDSVISSLMIKELNNKTNIINKEIADIHVALTCFFAFSNLLDTPQCRKKYLEDYKYYKKIMRQFSPALIRKYSSRKMTILWSICMINPTLYKFTGIIRSKRRR